MANDVLTYVREVDPRLAQVPDEELTLFLGETHPEFLKDYDFGHRFDLVKRKRFAAEQNANASPSIGRKLIGHPIAALTDFAAASGPMFAAQLAKGFFGEDRPLEELTTFKVAQKLHQMAEDARPEVDPNAGPVERFLTETVPSGLAYAGAFTLGGGVVRKLTESALKRTAMGAAKKKLAATVAGVGSAATFGAGANGADAYYDALEHGANEAQAFDTYWANALITGPTEAIPIAPWINKITGGNKAKKLIKELLVEGSEEAVQEVYQTIVSDAIAKDIYDPERDIWDAAKIGEAGAAGFTVGALYSWLTGLASRRGARFRDAHQGLPDPMQGAEPPMSGDGSVPINVDDPQAPTMTPAQAIQQFKPTPLLSAQEAMDQFGPRQPQHTIVGGQLSLPLEPGSVDGSVLHRPSDEATLQPEQAPAAPDGGTELQTAAAEAEVQAEAAETAAKVEQAAAETDTAPSDAQKEAGNYKKGKVNVHGLTIAIENPRGSTRSGINHETGQEWSVEMQHHYGDIKRTEGADGDPVDVFVGPNPASETVWIVDQVDPDGEFDEHKVMLGFDSEEEAVDGYRSNYEEDWVVGPVTQMSIDDFKQWLRNGDNEQPASEFIGGGEEVVEEPAANEIRQPTPADLEAIEEDWTQRAQGFIDNAGPEADVESMTTVFGFSVESDHGVRLTQDQKDDLARKVLQNVGRAEGLDEGPAETSLAPVEPKQEQKPAKPEKAPDPAEVKLRNLIDGAIRRANDEAQGQAILDEMEKLGISPRSVVKDFWTKSWPYIEESTRKRFEKMIEDITGLKPGDAVAVYANGDEVIGKDWSDVYPHTGVVEEVRHLEGTERGLVSLMYVANQGAGQMKQAQPAETWSPASGKSESIFPTRPAPREETEADKRYENALSEMRIDLRNQIDRALEETHPTEDFTPRLEKMLDEWIADEKGITDEHRKQLKSMLDHMLEIHRKRPQAATVPPSEIPDEWKDSQITDEGIEKARTLQKSKRESRAKHEHRAETIVAVEQKQPVHPEAAEAYGVEIPEGYYENDEGILEYDEDRLRGDKLEKEKERVKQWDHITGGDRVRAVWELDGEIIDAEVDVVGSGLGTKFYYKYKVGNQPYEDQVFLKSELGGTERIKSIEKIGETPPPEPKPEPAPPEPFKRPDYEPPAPSVTEMPSIEGIWPEPNVEIAKRFGTRQPEEERILKAVHDEPERFVHNIRLNRLKGWLRELAEFRRELDKGTQKLIRLKGLEKARFINGIDRLMNAIKRRPDGDDPEYISKWQAKVWPFMEWEENESGDGLKQTIIPKELIGFYTDEQVEVERKLYQDAFSLAAQYKRKLPADNILERVAQIFTDSWLTMSQLSRARAYTAEEIKARSVNASYIVDERNLTDPEAFPVAPTPAKPKKAKKKDWSPAKGSKKDAIEYQGSIPKTLRAFTEKHRDKIASVWEEGEDGYWINLREGWVNSEADTSTVHEWKVADAIQVFKDFVERREAAPEAKPTVEPVSVTTKIESKEWGASNKVFTKEMADKARKRILERLKSTNMLDGEIVTIGVQLAGYHIEAGARKFGDYAKALITDLGDEIRPYLKTWYWAVYDSKDFDETGMDDPATVMAIDVDAIEVETAAERDEGVEDEETGSEIRSGDEETSRDPGSGRSGRGESEREGDLDDVGDGVPETVSDVGESGDLEGDGERAGRPSVSGSEEDGGRVPGESGDSEAGTDPDGRGDGSRVSGEPHTPGRPNYHLTEPEKLIAGGPKDRFRRNQLALQTYDEVLSSGREPTPADLDALASYTGWGSFGQELFQGSYDNPQIKKGWESESAWLRDHLGEKGWKSVQESIINAHYTDPDTVQTMWDMVRHFGFKGGRVLEPSIGIGNFFSLMPRDLMDASDLTGIEMDSVSAGMAKMLHPQSNIQVKGYQESQTANNFYDLVIGNWPFSDNKPADREYNHLNASLHDFFFVKALDQVRPGGLVIGITSHSTMDKKSPKIRRWLAARGELVTAIRLPSGQFGKYAGTKVVTDIIVLKKKHDKDMTPTDSWIESDPNDEKQFWYNRYFHENPDNIIGQIGYGHGTTTGQAGMIVDPPAKYEERLLAALRRLPDDIMGEWEAPRSNVSFIGAGDNTARQMSLTIENGELYQKQGEQLAIAHDIKKWKLKDDKKTQKRLEEISAAIEIRDKLDGLIAASRGNQDTKEPRKELRRAYDAFVGKYGNVQDSKMVQYMVRLGDPSAPSVVNLEDSNGSPREIMFRDTMRPAPKATGENIEDAYALHRNNSILLDLAEIAKIANTTESKVRDRLIELDQIYLTPVGTWQSRDQYIAGNVRRKLREAEEAVAQGKSDLERNVEALKEALPPDVAYMDIEVRMGANWISTDDYRDFFAHLLNARPNVIEVKRQATGYKVSVKDPEVANSSAATTTWGTSKAPIFRFFSSAINGNPMKITVKDHEGKVDQALSQQATEEANNKVESIREEFDKWIWTDPDRTVRLSTEYNEANNSVVTPQRSGSHLRLEGLALKLGDNEFDFREHQRDAVWRFLQDGKGMAAHEVGTGKTFTMAGLVMEGRRLGVLRKPVVFAHNANSAGVASDFRAAYPAGKFLYLGSLSPKEVLSRLSQVALDDWDAVIVPHSLLDRFTLRKETMMELAQDQIQALEDEIATELHEMGVRYEKKDLDDEEVMNGKLQFREGAVTAKQLVKARRRIIDRIEKKSQENTRKDAVYFEDLGIDSIVVDEAHVFKKINLATRKQLKGLNKAESKPGFNLSLITDYVKRESNGKGTFLFTGTPVTNTLNEVYNMMRYVMSTDMAESGIEKFDDWFNLFAEAEDEVELTSTGEYEAISRLRRFINMPELARMAGRYFDVVQARDMPEFIPRESDDGMTEDPIGRPRKQIVDVSLPMNPAQKRYQEQIRRRAKRWKEMSPRDRRLAMLEGAPEVPIRIDGDASSAALDIRLVEPGADATGGKTDVASENILRYYDEHEKSTQMVFLEQGFNDYTDRIKTRKTADGRTETDADGKPIKDKTRVRKFNIARDLVEKLVEKGVKPSEIAIFANLKLDPADSRPDDVLRRVHKISTKTTKEDLAAMMREGKIRVAIGQTETMGTGVNAQTYMRAMHHLDAPWMPGSLEQRNGRGWRQGNKWNTVYELRYVTEESGDGKRWQTLLNKVRFIHRFIELLQTGGEGVRVLEGEGADTSEDGSIGDFESSFSAAAGDPRQMLKTQYQKQVRTLEKKWENHTRERRKAKDAIVANKQKIEGRNEYIEKLERDNTLAKELAELPFEIEIEGETYTDRKKADTAIESLPLPTKGRYKAGQFGPFEIEMAMYQGVGGGTYFYINGPNGTAHTTGSTSVMSLESTLRGLTRRITNLKEEVEGIERTFPGLRELSEKPFSRQEELDAKRKALAGIEAEIRMSPFPAPPWLRNTTPKGSIVYLEDGTSVDVLAHRWDRTNWWVLYEDKFNNMRPVPYHKVFDEQGNRIFEDRPFEAPGDETALAPMQDEARSMVSDQPMFAPNLDLGPILPAPPSIAADIPGLAMFSLGNPVDPATDAQVRAAVASNKVDKVGGNRGLEDGHRVGLRLDIPSYNKNGTYVVTVHEKNIGKVIGYDGQAAVTDPTFKSSEGAAKMIRDGFNPKTGKKVSKSPMATVEGAYSQDTSLPEDLTGWAQVGFNPKVHSYFYDKITGLPVIGGSRAVMVGNTVYVQDPQFGRKEDFLFSVAPFQDGTSRPEVGQAVVNVLGSVPDNVVIHRADETPTHRGRAVRGYFHNGQIHLFPANIDSVEQAEEVLIEELGHQIANDDGIQSAYQDLAESVPDSAITSLVKQGYSRTHAREEAVMRMIVGEWSARNAKQKGLIKRLLDAISKFLAKLGIKTKGAKVRELLSAALENKQRGGKQRQSLGDDEYMKAVEAGDMKKAQQMVDEAAKDAGYNLTPLYHKTWSDFTKFIPGGKDAERQTWYNKDRQRTMVGPSGRAIWLSMDKEDTPAYHNAKKKGERLLKLYAKMQVPLIMDADTHDWAVDVFADGVKDFPLLVTEEARKEVLEGGHDSIHFFGRGKINIEGTPREVVVFDANQVKSAEAVVKDDKGNVIPLSERFTDSDDIRYSLGRHAVSIGQGAIGRIMESRLEQLEHAENQLDEDSYDRSQYRQAHRELRRLRELAQGRMETRPRRQQYAIPGIREGVGLPEMYGEDRVEPEDWIIQVDSTFVDALAEMGLEFNRDHVMDMQAEIYFEKTARRVYKNRLLMAELAERLRFLRNHNPDGVINEQLKMLEARIKMIRTRNQNALEITMARRGGFQTVEERAADINDTESTRVDNLGARKALYSEVVQSVFGNRVESVRTAIENALAAEGNMDPEQFEKVRDLIDGLPVDFTDNEAGVINVALSHQFLEYDRRRKEFMESVPEREKALRNRVEQLEKEIVKARSDEGMAEVMLMDAFATFAGERGLTGTLESEDQVQAVINRLGAVQVFARKLADNVDSNIQLYNWLLYPTDDDIGGDIADPSALGVSRETLDTILAAVKESPELGSAILGLSSFAGQKMSEIPALQIKSISQALEGGHYKTALGILGHIIHMTNAQGAAAKALNRKTVNDLRNVMVELRSIEVTKDMFESVDEDGVFNELRAHVESSDSAHTEKMYVGNNEQIVLKPFGGSEDIPTHRGVRLSSKVAEATEEERVKEVLEWAEAANDYVTGWRLFHEAFINDPNNHPSPHELGYDAPTARGLEAALLWDVPIFLDQSGLKPGTRLAITPFARSLMAAPYIGAPFRQFDKSAQAVEGIFGRELAARWSDFTDNVTKARGIRRRFMDLDKLSFAAMKSHPAFGMDIEVYRESVWNEMADYGREFGTEVKPGFRLPKSGVVLTKEDVALLKRDYEFSNALRREIQEMRPDSGIRETISGRELIRKGASPGDLALPRRLSGRGGQFVTGILEAYRKIDGPSEDVNVFDDNSVHDFWNRNAHLLTDHVMDSRKRDRTVQIDGNMLRAYRNLARKIRDGGSKPESVEDLVVMLTAPDVFPAGTGLNPSTYVEDNINQELHHYFQQASEIKGDVGMRATTTGVEIAASVNSEFTKPAARLRLPSSLYNYGNLSQSEIFHATMRVNHERLIEYVAALDRNIAELDSRLNEKTPEEHRLKGQYKSLAEMQQTRQILAHLRNDIVRVFNAENEVYAGGYQTAPLMFRFVLDNLLASIATQLRNITLGQFLFMIQHRKIAKLGGIAVYWKTFRHLYKTGAATAIEFITPIADARDSLGKLIRTNKGKKWADNFVTQALYRMADAGFGERRDELLRLGAFTKEPFIEGWRQNFREMERVERGIDKRNRVSRFIGLLLKSFSEALRIRSVEWSDMIMNAVNIESAYEIEGDLRRLAIEYGDRRRANPDLPRLVQPNEWATRMTAGDRRNALASLRSLLETSLSGYGFQLEDALERYYENRHDPNAQFFTDDQFDAFKRRIMADYNMTTLGNRPALFTANRFAGGMGAFQGYPANLTLQIMEGFAKAKGANWREEPFQEFVAFAMRAFFMLGAAIFTGLVAKTVVDLFRQIAFGRYNQLPNPTQIDRFWKKGPNDDKAEKVLGIPMTDRNLAIVTSAASSFGFFGEAALALSGETVNGKGFDPANKVVAISVANTLISGGRGFSATEGGTEYQLEAAKDTALRLSPMTRDAVSVYDKVTDRNLAYNAYQIAVSGLREIGYDMKKRGSSNRTFEFGPTTAMNRKLMQHVMTSSHDKARKVLEDILKYKTQVNLDRNPRWTPDYAREKAEAAAWTSYQSQNPLRRATGQQRMLAKHEYDDLFRSLAPGPSRTLSEAMQKYAEGGRQLFGKTPNLWKNQNAKPKRSNPNDLPFVPAARKSRTGLPRGSRDLPFVPKSKSKSSNPLTRSGVR